MQFVFLNKVIFCNFDKFIDNHTKLIRLNTQNKNSLIGKQLKILIKRM